MRSIHVETVREKESERVGEKDGETERGGEVVMKKEGSVHLKLGGRMKLYPFCTAR